MTNWKVRHRVNRKHQSYTRPNCQMSELENWRNNWARLHHQTRLYNIFQKISPGMQLLAGNETWNINTNTYPYQQPNPRMTSISKTFLSQYDLRSPNAN